MFVRGKSIRNPNGPGYVVTEAEVWLPLLGQFVPWTREMCDDIPTGVSLFGYTSVTSADGKGGYLLPPGTPPELVAAARESLDDADTPHVVTEPA